ncbi:hypothetical protein N7466_003219 [Penicillium verhagenii]|uniref:uncharacterized protein n=1 Tax=Penicillium verhagenii TaxID=1562060 RepID=UPI00254500B5|nr:uncharacterized protein N7466_003219 [Penicillium verhagenii]KAJ5936769.1 hypothetical protein N7466_003219 [Penicillium verhagenii]
MADQPTHGRSASLPNARPFTTPTRPPPLDEATTTPPATADDGTPVTTPAATEDGGPGPSSQLPFNTAST